MSNFINLYLCLILLLCVKILNMFFLTFDHDLKFRISLHINYSNQICQVSLLVINMFVCIHNRRTQNLIAIRLRI